MAKKAHSRPKRAEPLKPDALVSLIKTLEIDRAPLTPTPISSEPHKIPRTALSRLSALDASPTPFPSTHIPSSSLPRVDGANTVLYLAYGSNLAAEVFQGTRGVKPLSAVPVSVPTLRLTFELAGIPYREPCFANVALRKLPKPPVPIPDPPKTPPKIPDLPGPPAKLPWEVSEHVDGVERNAAGDAIWTKGLIGVVYEVTREDYATIIRTEGGGSSYQDVLVPCIPIPPRMRVPEKPPIPELPRPFLAHTLFAPRLPDDPRDDSDVGAEQDGDKPKNPHPHPRPRVPKWAHKFFLPVRRPDPDYAQASARYLGLITEGAREHELPADYQRYLDALQPYTITSCRQKIGGALIFALWFPFVMFVLILQRLWSDKKTGRAPTWLALSANLLFNLVWFSYDHIFKPLFGDGERTEEDSDGQGTIRLESGQTSRTGHAAKMTMS